MKNILILLMAIFLLSSCAKNTTIVVENPTDHSRHEVIDLNLEDLNVGGPFIIKDAQNQEVKYQITHDRKVVFLVDIEANSQATFTLEPGQPTAPDPIAVGRHYPERLDDIAWENDKVAFRTYGPALQRSGERAFGYDVWTKKVPHPVVEKRYATELNPETIARVDSLRKAKREAMADSLERATSYHYDHGEGHDCYKVGPTLGGGTAAIMLGDTIIYPYCYKNFEILDNGPLRFAVKLVYEPTFVAGDSVTEERIIVLDAGSHFNKTSVKYHGLKHDVDVATGIVLHHPDGGQNIADHERGIIAYVDPTDGPDVNNGDIFMGAYVPNCHEAKAQMFDDKERDELRGGANGHMLAKAHFHPGDEFKYFWGNGWSKYGFDSFDQWKNHLEQFVDNQKNPLLVTIK